MTIKIVFSKMDHLIIKHFLDGNEYGDVLKLLQEDGIRISLSTLKRHLRALNLGRRKYGDPERIVDFIESKINSEGRDYGYRFMHLECIRNNVIVPRDVVSQVMKTLDPEGVASRLKGSLKRREYFVEGPNYLWHLDGWDKIKPYGIALHGGIDGFSSCLLWLEAGRTNNNPEVIADYYLNATQRRGVPVCVRTDLGTENVYVEVIQKYLREKYSDTNFPAYMKASSVHNQRIESFWNQLRKRKTQYYMDAFNLLVKHGFFVGDKVDKSLIRFCFLQTIQNDLNEFMQLWNNHRIRASSGERAVFGKPNIMYKLPHKYNVEDCIVDVDPMEFHDLRRDYGRHNVDESFDEALFALCELEMQEQNLTKTSDRNENVDLYLRLRPQIRNEVLD